MTRENDVGSPPQGDHAADTLQVLQYLADTVPGAEQKSLSAFEALFVTAGWVKLEVQQKLGGRQWTPAPGDAIPVPWWVVNYLGHAWIRYLEAPTGSTLGEALELEGGGQGKRQSREGWKIFRRDMRLAVLVAEARDAAQADGRRLTLEDAFAAVGQSENCSEDMVRRAWKKNGKQVSEARKFRGATS